ncbi:MAG: DUF262 domain-containing protein [Clostridiales bacterium]|nr:DUF262 domain-containing protein [Clostridiales bacterium]
MSTPRTLLELLSEYRVIIPRVQRDYVQGRKDEHSTIVRKNLLRDIKNAFDSVIDPLDLNFVYGKTTVDKAFFPVDGQQRLTTLFLIHIFAFADDETKDKDFLKFSYQARTTTRDFFEALVNNRANIFNYSESPEVIVRDADWFIDSWKYDPSINNALTTLNDIVSLKFDRDILKAQLEETNNPRVFFQFVKLDELGMEDDLYIKLNARGRALTSFENFKSRLIDRCKDVIPILYDEIKSNLDGQWADTIWEIGTNGDEGYDDFYLRFFETMFLNYGLLKAEANKTVSKNWIYNLDYHAISATIFTTISNTLNYLSNNKDSIAYQRVIDAIKKNTSYPEKVLFHAVCMYLHDEPLASNVDNSLLNDWLRVFDNLVVNSRIEEADVYIRAISSINQLRSNKNSILSLLSSGVIKDLAGFQKEQFDEECQKARIMCKDITHRQAIIDAEKKLPYFQSQIRCVLYCSNIEIQDDLLLLEQYVKKLSALFDTKKPINGILLRRALCSIGDYRLSVGNYKTLCIDDPNESSRTWSLKKLFSNHGEEVRRLLSIIDPTKPIDPQLEELINSNHLSQKDWRYCFVHYSKTLFPMMSPSHLRMFNNTYEELLVPNKQSNGENYSVHLFVLKELLRGKGINSEYYTEKGAWGERYLVVRNLKVSFKNMVFTVEGDSGTWKTSSDSVLDEVVEHIIEIVT